MNSGFIHLILGNPIVNRTANNIFELYQEEAFKRPFFRRYPLQSVRGRMLTNYFSQNSGVPYKYIAGTGNTTPFEHAPQAVNEALQLIKDRARLAVGKSVDFNEVLSAAYMEKQKMSFHSDSEPGLGTVLSSLSLGSEALMHFRLRAKFKDVKRAKGHSQNELTIRLRHGDVLVMQGQDIQDKYEHTVVPTNFRIAATARFIDATGRLSQFPDDFQDDSSPHMESDFIPTYPINKYNNPHDTLAR
ncbi:hypothetical protein BD410DRAFT_716233 [Rickenella mellea]|uniref:Alpha-ketoglutarate-dependent dioxygenase AlkB-like domain-containing protein n=1 Tax=Rickenella mellea TaxID=50990 RepID=A0A4Y7QF30_9AGAM|nr:hypothetical protein BD410DRAFT_716233 [Rickenella mellea]